MQSESLCIPCFLTQAHSSVAAVTSGSPQEGFAETRRQEVLKAVAAMIPELDMSRSPSYNSSVILHKVNELLGVDDPYKEQKAEHNKMALSMLPGLRERVKASADPLETAIRLSVVGNVIDLGIKHEADIDETIEKALGDGFAKFEIEEFKSRLDGAQRLMYVLDNAGEIVFDILVLEELRRLGKAVIAVVKSGPVINDATMDDAIQVGLDKLCKIIESGSNFVGLERDLISDLTKKVLDSADVVIAKGQGNYETLEGTSDRIFFLLKAKCGAVAGKLGIQEGQFAFTR